MRELQRKLFPNPLISAGVHTALAMPNPWQKKSMLGTLEKLAKLLVEEDEEAARYPELPSILGGLAAAEKDIHLRFGEAPEGGRSFCSPGMQALSAYKEKGTSTFSGTLTTGGFLIGCEDVGLRAYVILLTEQDRQAYYVRGRCVERRRTGERVLADTTFEPVPETAIIAVKDSPSRALERWLSRRGVDVSGLVKSA